MSADLIAECVLPLPCVLGEGPLWRADEQRLYFVDIKGCALHAYHPSTQQHLSWQMPQMVGWLQPWHEGGWVAGLQGGVARVALAPQGGSVRWSWLHQMHEPASPMRLNDAKVDGAGRLWFGTMNGVNESQPAGALWQWSSNHAHPTLMDSGYLVTNGPTFSLDGRRLFHADSGRRVVYVMDVDAATGTLSGKRAWLQLTGPVDVEGYPDGMATDAAGHVWVARWGAGCVVQHGPDGEELQRIHTGAPHTTSMAFGGPQLRDLYITSARAGLSESALARTTLSGALFCAKDVGQGMPASAWRHVAPL